MAVKIRLTRGGSKKKPFYRVVAADSRMPRDGRHLEIVGRYNPRTEPSYIEFDKDKVIKWLSRGAQPTDTVKNLLRVSGIALEKKSKEKIFKKGGAAKKVESKALVGSKAKTETTKKVAKPAGVKGTKARTVKTAGADTAKKNVTKDKQKDETTTKEGKNE